MAAKKILDAAMILSCLPPPFTLADLGTSSWSRRMNPHNKYTTSYYLYFSTTTRRGSSNDVSLFTVVLINIYYNNSK